MRFITSALIATLSIANYHAYAYDHASGLCTDDVDAMAASAMGGKNDLRGIGWTLTASSKSYNESGTIEIGFKPKNRNDMFKGLLLFASDADGKHAGKFISLPGDFQTMDQLCKQNGPAGSTLSHKNANPKPATLKFKWKAPETGVGPVEFRGLLVTTSRSLWMAFPPLNITGPGSPGGKSSNETVKDDPSGDAAGDNNSLMWNGFMLLLSSLAITSVPLLW